MRKLSVLILGFVVLSGCSKYASNGERLYLQSRNGQKIAVPPPLTSGNVSNFYDLPEQNKKARVTIVPPASGVS